MNDVPFEKRAKSYFRRARTLIVGSKAPPQKALQFFVYSRNITARFLGVGMWKIQLAKNLFADFDLPVRSRPLPGVQKIKNVGKTPNVWLVTLGELWRGKVVGDWIHHVCWLVEVDQFDVVFVIDEYILRIQILVHVTHLMQVVEGGDDLSADVFEEIEVLQGPLLELPNKFRQADTFK